MGSTKKEMAKLEWHDFGRKKLKNCPKILSDTLALKYTSFFRCLMGSREDSRSRSESESDDSDRSSTESTNEQEEGERSPTPQKKSKKSKSHKKVFSDPITPAPVWSEIFKLNSISGPLRTVPWSTDRESQPIVFFQK